MSRSPCRAAGICFALVRGHTDHCFSRSAKAVVLVKNSVFLQDQLLLDEPNKKTLNFSRYQKISTLSSKFLNLNYLMFDDSNALLA